MRKNPKSNSDLSSLPRLERENNLRYSPIDLTRNDITIDSHLSLKNCKNITNDYKGDLCSLLSKYESLIIIEKKSIKYNNSITTINIVKELILILINIVKFNYIIMILETINSNINNIGYDIIEIIKELYNNESLEYNTIISSLINIFKRKSQYVIYNIQNPSSEETQKKLKYEKYKNILGQNFDTSSNFIRYINVDKIKCSELIKKIIYYIENELSEQYKQLKKYYIDNPQIDIENQDRIVTYYFDKYKLKSKIDNISTDFNVSEINKPSTGYYKKYLKYKQKYLELKKQINQ